MLAREHRGRTYTRGTRLAALLAQHSLFAYEAAGDIGISPRRLSDYLNGKAEISTAHLIKICNYFGVEPEEVLGRVEPAGDPGEVGTPG